MLVCECILEENLLATRSAKREFELATTALDPARTSIASPRGRLNELKRCLVIEGSPSGPSGERVGASGSFTRRTLADTVLLESLS
jgi:hypothetical protein